MSDDLVSVIIPCYQQGRFLRDCVNSLKNQTYSHWEAIIVNDGSTDETEKLALQLVDEDARVKYLSKPNGGLSSARNKGLLGARGCFIQFLDADDQIEKRKLEVQVSTLQKHSSLGLVYGNAKYFTDGKFGIFRRIAKPRSDDRDWITEAWNNPQPLLYKLLERNMFPVCSPLIRSHIIKRVGLFNETLPALEDWEYWFRCAACGVEFMFLTDSGTDALIRTHISSMTQDAERMAKSEFLLRLAMQCVLSDDEPNVRAFNLRHLIVASAALGIDGKRVRYHSMKRACKTLRENLFIDFASFFNTNSSLFLVARRIVRVMPTWLRQSLGI